MEARRMYDCSSPGMRKCFARGLSYGFTGSSSFGSVISAATTVVHHRVIAALYREIVCYCTLTRRRGQALHQGHRDPARLGRVVLSLPVLKGGSFFFIVILLIGTGWSFLQEREKKVLMVVIMLQVIDNIAAIGIRVAFLLLFLLRWRMSALMDRIRTSPSDVIVTDKKDSTNKRTFKFNHSTCWSFFGPTFDGSSDRGRRIGDLQKKEGGEPPTLKNGSIPSNQREYDDGILKDTVVCERIQQDLGKYVGTLISSRHGQSYARSMVTCVTASVMPLVK
ncbi:hypothetical protein QJS10_CPB21g01021 [Acorus calamus]|uniref:Uncharacterized protein n=1 Tax=Acorus calamus TaxID=4465 RepID=A0AAV9C3R2_ACOCL|nr:hypothetical protein QJS10_CPB21g01021 [Acorus calamus]